MSRVVLLHPWVGGTSVGVTVGPGRPAPSVSVLSPVGAQTPQRDRSAPGCRPAHGTVTVLRPPELTRLQDWPNPAGDFPRSSPVRGV